MKIRVWFCSLLVMQLWVSFNLSFSFLSCKMGGKKLMNYRMYKKRDHGAGEIVQFPVPT